MKSTFTLFFVACTLLTNAQGGKPWMTSRPGVDTTKKRPPVSTMASQTEVSTPTPGTPSTGQAIVLQRQVEITGILSEDFTISQSGNLTYSSIYIELEGTTGGTLINSDNDPTTKWEYGLSFSDDNKGNVGYGNANPNTMSAGIQYPMSEYNGIRAMLEKSLVERKYKAYLLISINKDPNGTITSRSGALRFVQN